MNPNLHTDPPSPPPRCRPCRQARWLLATLGLVATVINLGWQNGPALGATSALHARPQAEPAGDAAAAQGTPPARVMAQAGAIKTVSPAALAATSTPAPVPTARPAAGTASSAGASAIDTPAAAAAASHASPANTEPAPPAPHGDDAPGAAVARGVTVSPAASFADAAGQPTAPTLLYRTVPLRSGYRGELFRDLPLARHLSNARVMLVDGQLPPGLSLSDEGIVRGVPTLVGRYQFRLGIIDPSPQPTPPPTPESASPAPTEAPGRLAARAITHQAYALRILPPATKAPAPPPVASAVTPTPVPLLQSLSATETESFVDHRRGMPVSYKLTPADVAMLMPAEETAAPSSASSPTSPTPPTPPTSSIDTPSRGTALSARDSSEPGDSTAADITTLPLDAAMQTTTVAAPILPTVDQLKALLAPLVDIDYPTRPLFEQALLASRCDYYQLHVTEQALKKKLRVDATCPPLTRAISTTTTSTSAPAARAGNASRPVLKPVPDAAKHLPANELSLQQFYLDLLPPELQAQIVTLAEKLHPIEDSQAPRLTASCGCYASDNGNTVYGIFPYWLATDTAQKVDFSLFKRIAFMGAVMKDDGSLSVPNGWAGEPGGFARVASRHGSELDLVIYRRDWTGLLRQPAAKLDELARTAARNAVQMAEAKRDDGPSRWLRPLLLPAWREREQVYGGLTIMFDDAALSTSEQRAAFKRFYRQFTLRLITEMQAIGRSYQLNFIVPEQQLGDEDGAYGFGQLTDYMETAQRGPRDPNTDEETLHRYRGTTDISVFYLMMMGEPTSTFKKELRRKIDETRLLQGHRRVAFLQGVIPVQFDVRTDKPVPMAPDLSRQVDDDLAYMRWNFGGVGFWPLPVEGLGQGSALRQLIEENYKPPATLASGLCAWACPNRVALRLLLQCVLIIGLALLATYARSCRAQHAGGRQLLLALWGIGLITLVMAATVFSCDPLMNELRAGNAPLYVLILLLCVAGAYTTLRKPMDAP